MATGTSNRRRPRRGRHTLSAAAALAVVATAVAVAAVAGPGHSPGRGFPALAPMAAPAGWRHLTLPNGAAVLSYPPTLHRIAGDSDAVSVARLGPHGKVQLYLNATPRQGTESLRGFAAFRLRLLRSDDAVTARQIAAARGVAFRHGTGSCVIDTYLTRIGHHHYQEIACLAQGRTSASVIVAAATGTGWSRARPLLLRAVAAYQVR